MDEFNIIKQDGEVWRLKKSNKHDQLGWIRDSYPNEIWLLLNRFNPQVGIDCGDYEDCTLEEWDLWSLLYG